MFIEEMTPVTPQLVSPSGSQSSSRLRFLWYPADKATSYQLSVEKQVTSGSPWTSLVTNKTIRSGATVCDLAGFKNGYAYRWRVRGVNLYVAGEWSDTVTFSLGGGGVPLTIIALSPTGIVSDHTPTFRWNADTRATSYEVVVKQGSTTIFDQTGVIITSLDSPVSLADGTYTWYVRGINGSSAGPWSEVMSFAVGSVGYVYNVALTWGSSPSDLDSHLTTPDGFHVYWSSTGSSTESPYAQLDRDDTDGYGPENISIYRVSSGTYKYYVHQYSSSGSLAGCNARVMLVDAGGNVRVDCRVPSTGSGAYWHVFDIVNGSIVTVNTITSSAP
jgi:hypothetical protein